MPINLSTYSAVQSNLFIKIEVDEYRTTPNGGYSSQILTFSDRLESYTLDSDVYVGLGRLMSVSGTNSELRSSSGTLSITISGIPNSSIAEIVNSKIKGSPVRITRVLFDPTTNLPLEIQGNPLARFRGFVNNYTLTEDWDNTSRTSSNTITLVCASSIDVLSNKTAGRKTNPQSQKQFYPNDVSMNRVPTLENATFDFGAPK